jgi:hypothetical protein
MRNLENRVSHLEQQMARSAKPDAETKFDPLVFEEVLSAAIESAKRQPPRTQEEIIADAKAFIAAMDERFSMQRRR